MPKLHSPALLAILLAALLTGNAFADAADKHLLRYDFKMGEVLRYRVKHTAHVRSTMEETTQEVESTSESIKAWKVTDVLPNGEIEFIHVVESAKMSNRRPQQPFAEFDSTVDKEPPAFFAQAAKSIGVPLTQIRMTPSGKIVDREEKHPQPAASDDMPITLQMPDHAIAVGAKWDHVYAVQAERQSGAKMKVRTRRLCRLKSVKQAIATIDVTYQILTPIDAHVKSQLVERLTDGTVKFDVARGRIASQEHTVDQRVVGFAGKASSMHFNARLEERLLKPGEELASGKSRRTSVK